jgi:hypothetical protein
MNYFFTACFTFRRLVFKTCVSAASKVSKIGNMFRDVVLLLQGAEMNHIILIDMYLFNKYPELLSLRQLRYDLMNYNAAMEFLSKIPSSERMHVKLLYPRDQTGILNRNNFPLLAAAATVVARYENPSFRFYPGAAEDTLGTSLKGVIINYLSSRVNMAPIAMSNSCFAYLSAEEQKRLRQQVEEEGEVIPSLFTLPQIPESEIHPAVPQIVIPTANR